MRYFEFNLGIFPGLPVSAAALLCLSGAATAQQVCIDCSEPQAVYACSIEKSDRIQAIRNSDRAIGFACVKAIAQLGGHASCRASQKNSGQCQGQQVVLTAAQLLAFPPPPEMREPAAAKTGEGQQGGPPRTMQELAQNTWKDSKDGLENAGETVKNAGKAVGGAFQKTWDCLTSLFNRC